MTERLVSSEVVAAIGDLVTVGKRGNTFHRPNGKFLSRHEIEQIIAHADLIKGETGEVALDGGQMHDDPAERRPGATPISGGEHYDGDGEPDSAVEHGSNVGVMTRPDDARGNSDHEAYVTPEFFDEPAADEPVYDSDGYEGEFYDYPDIMEEAYYRRLLEILELNNPGLFDKYKDFRDRFIEAHATSRGVDLGAFADRALGKFGWTKRVRDRYLSATHASEHIRRKAGKDFRDVQMQVRDWCANYYLKAEGSEWDKARDREVRFVFDIQETLALDREITEKRLNLARQQKGLFPGERVSNLLGMTLAAVSGAGAAAVEKHAEGNNHVGFLLVAGALGAVSGAASVKKSLQRDSEVDQFVREARARDFVKSIYANTREDASNLLDESVAVAAIEKRTDEEQNRRIKMLGMAAVKGAAVASAAYGASFAPDYLSPGSSDRVASGYYNNVAAEHAPGIGATPAEGTPVSSSDIAATPARHQGGSLTVIGHSVGEATAAAAERAGGGMEIINPQGGIDISTAESSFANPIVDMKEKGSRLFEVVRDGAAKIYDTIRDSSDYVRDATEGSPVDVYGREGFTDLLQRYAAAHGYGLDDLQAYDLYKYLVEVKKIDPSHIIGGSEVFRMENGDFGITHAGKIHVPIDVQGEIKEWLDSSEAARAA